MAQKRKIPNTNEPNIYIYSIIGGVIGVAVSVLLILLSPFILIKTSNPNSFSTATALFCLLIGGFASSFATALRLGSDAIKTGLFIGLAMILIILPISFFVSGEFDLTGALLTVAVIMVSAFLGGFLVHRLNTDQKRNMKKVLKRR